MKNITPNQGAKIIAKIYPRAIIKGCLEYPGFYLYMIGSVVDNGPSATGHVFDAVDKKTGKHFLYDILDNPEGFRKAKKINIKTVLDKVI